MTKQNAYIYQMLLSALPLGIIQIGQAVKSLATFDPPKAWFAGLIVLFFIQIEFKLLGFSVVERSLKESVGVPRKNLKQAQTWHSK